MNHQIWTLAGARVIAAAFVIAGAAACGERDTNLSSRDADGASQATKSGLPSDASPSAVVIGTAPAQPTGDTPQTTSSAEAQSQLSKSQEVNAMPREGDNHSYSTTDPNSPQKAGGVDPVAAESKQ